MPHQTYIIWLEVVVVGNQIYRHNKVVCAEYFHFLVQHALSNPRSPGNHLVIWAHSGWSLFISYNHIISSHG